MRPQAVSTLCRTLCRSQTRAPGRSVKAQSVGPFPCSAAAQLQKTPGAANAATGRVDLVPDLVPEINRAPVTLGIRIASLSQPSSGSDSSHSPPTTGAGPPMSAAVCVDLGRRLRWLASRCCGCLRRFASGLIDVCSNLHLGIETLSDVCGGLNWRLGFRAYWNQLRSIKIDRLSSVKAQDRLQL